MSDANRTQVAYHEAGHAVIAIAVGVPVNYATVRPTADSTGHVHYAIQFGGMEEAAILFSVLAGPVSEARQFPAGPTLEHSSDLRCARTVIRLMKVFDLGKVRRPDDGEVNAILSTWREKTGRLVDRHWPWIVRVAEGLEKFTGLTGGEVLALRSSVDDETFAKEST